MTFLTNDNFEKLLTFLKDETKLKTSPLEHQDYKTFIEHFPAANIASLSLEQYCIGTGKNKSFCWWIERGLEPILGRYSPGNSRGHILYFQKDSSIYKIRQLQDLSDIEALSYTLKIQSLIANADVTQDLTWIDDDAELYRRAGLTPRVTIGDGRKLRLLNCYHPNDCLPISSSNHLKHFLQQFGFAIEDIPPDGKPVARMVVLRSVFNKAKESIPSLNMQTFMRALYSPELGLAPMRESSEPDDAPKQEGLANSIVLSAEGRPPLNTILYGPPGTGKTHATIDAALAILDPEFLNNHPETPGANWVAQRERRKALKQRFDELKSNNQIGFVTFHQSFSYEDFVEGLRAEKGENGQIHYPVVDGIFKNLCDAAAAKVTKQAEAPIDISGRRVWKMSLGNTLGSDEAYIYEECIKNGYVLLGYGDQVDFKGCQDKNEIYERFVSSGLTVSKDAYAVSAVGTFILKMKVGDLVVVTEGNTKFRAIGEVTGNYRYLSREEAGDEYSQCRDVKWLRVYKPSLPSNQLMHNQFSQMTLYQLHSGSIDMDALAGLLQTQAPVSDLTTTGLFKEEEKFGNYIVRKISADLLELEKPKGNTLPVAMSILETLASYVRQGQISIGDIRDKQVFEKIPTTKLEPYLVNGYSNILPALVERLVQTTQLTSTTNLPQKTTQPDAKVLIIDEINRGNVSRIFGELITLIEPSKRAGADEALEVTLPYSKDRFSIPANVFLIGTMNTADRSLAGLDIALRRRFVFQEMPPKPELLDDISIPGVNSIVNVGLLLRAMNERIEVLLDRDHCLGHAYFLPLKEHKTIDHLAFIFRQQILPLLQEYFFEDWERIAWVLNNQPFLQKASTDISSLFSSEAVSNLQTTDRRWRIDDAAFYNIENYLGILGAGK